MICGTNSTRMTALLYACSASRAGLPVHMYAVPAEPGYLSVTHVHSASRAGLHSASRATCPHVRSASRAGLPVHMYAVPARVPVSHTCTRSASQGTCQSHMYAVPARVPVSHTCTQCQPGYHMPHMYAVPAYNMAVSGQGYCGECLCWSVTSPLLFLSPPSLPAYS